MEENNGSLDLILEGIGTLYSPPQGADRNLALKEYAAALDGYEPAEYLAAWEKIRDTHKRQSWPSIPQIREILEEVKAGRSQVSSGEKTKAYEEAARSRPLRDKIEMADRIMRGPVGRVALEGGYPWGLWLSVIDNGRAPYDRELRVMREAAGETEAVVSGLQEREGYDRSTLNLISIGERIIQRNRILSEHYSSGSEALPDLPALGLV